MNYQASVQRSRAHVLQLAATPGWDRYAEDLAARYEREAPDLFHGLRDEVVAITLPPRTVRQGVKPKGVKC